MERVALLKKCGFALKGGVRLLLCAPLVLCACGNYFAVKLITETRRTQRCIEKSLGNLLLRQKPRDAAVINR
jgi:hypothetical protein